MIHLHWSMWIISFNIVAIWQRGRQVSYCYNNAIETSDLYPVSDYEYISRLMLEQELDTIQI